MKFFLNGCQLTVNDCFGYHISLLLSAKMADMDKRVKIDNPFDYLLRHLLNFVMKW